MKGDPQTNAYRFGEWLVNPETLRISSESCERRLQPKAFAVLIRLLESPGEIVSIGALLDSVWQDRVVEPSVVHWNVNQIRKTLGDDPKAPRYIETVAKRGYRTLAPVQHPAAAEVIPGVEAEAAAPASPTRVEASWIASAKAKLFGQHKGFWISFGAALLALVLGIAGYVLREPEVDPEGVVDRTSENGNLAANVALPPITSIAVMPFDDLSRNNDQGWLADGMTEELIDSLSRIERLRVPARNSTSILKDQHADAMAIGKHLDVGSIMEGSILRSDGQITVLARWSRVEDGQRLWSGRYERPFDDIFAVQREITIGIAEAIRTELGIGDASAHLSRQRYYTSDVRAWESLQKGSLLLRAYHPSLGPERLLKAREYLRYALELDPDYAEAHAMLVFTDYENPAGRVEGAKRVLTMDRANQTAQAVLVSDSLLHWDFQTAELLLDRMAAANPSARGLEIRHRLFLESGRLGAALEAAKWGLQLDPMAAARHTRLGHTYLVLGDVRQAIEHFEHGIRFAHETGQRGYWPIASHFELALAYHLAGRDRDAVKELFKLLPAAAVDRDQTWEAANLRLANFLVAQAGDPDEGPVDPTVKRATPCAAHILAQAGATDQAYACLEELIAGATYPLSQEIRTHPGLDPIRQQGRFQSLLQKLDQRVAEAAGTYEFVAGIQIDP